MPSNTILHAACQANHWTLLITHFTEKLSGALGSGILPERRHRKRSREAAKLCRPQLVWMYGWEQNKSNFRRTSYFTHSCALFHLEVLKSLWGKTKRRSSDTHFLVFQNCVHMIVIHPIPCSNWQGWDSKWDSVTPNPVLFAFPCMMLTPTTFAKGRS